MKKKILFINPPYFVNQHVPNMGLAYAATYFNVPVIDLNTKQLHWGRFLEEKADCLAVSVQSLSYNESKKIAEAYKKKYSKSKIKSISGFIDVQCCYPFVEFKSKIRYDKPFSDEYPFPKYELFDSFDIFKKKWQSGEWHFPLMTSLGCPFQCKYCMSKNRKWQTRSIQNCYEELKLAKSKYNIKSFQVVDDCFNASKSRVIEFCNAVKPLNLKWFCTNGLRADNFDEEVAKSLKTSGCDNISFGIESIDKDLLKSINKGETREQIQKAIKIARKYFTHVNGYFIISLPFSSYEKDLASLKWAVRNRINAHFSYYVPFDRTFQFDQTFYGKNAKPVSDAYDIKLQERLYKMTDFMRCDCHDSKFVRILKRIKLIWKFDKLHFPQQMLEWGLKLI